jgi:hypothetical protein
MAFKLDKAQAEVLTVEQSDSVSVVVRADNAKLAELGYRSEFRREFSVSQMLHLSSSVVDNLVSSSKAFGDGGFCYFNNGCCRLRNVDILLRPRQWFEPLACCMAVMLNLKTSQ